MLERYRPSMTSEVVRSWAFDAQRKINALTEILTELRDANETTFSMGEEGRNYLKRIDDILNM